jgi:hypothetical protein
MKNLLLFVIIFGMISTSLIAQTTPEESVKSAIEKLFKTCETDDLKAASKQIVYTGKDEKRNLQGLFNINDKKEASKINRTMKKVSAFLKISDKYEFGNYSNKTDDQILLHSIEVLFLSGEQQLTTTFSFVEVNSSYLLADIN